MDTVGEKTRHRRTRSQLLDDALPQFENFIESREKYITALETTIEALRHDNAKTAANNMAMRSSIDELLAIQQLSNAISTAGEPELIVSTLIELTKQVIPVVESNIFLFDEGLTKLIPLSSRGSAPLRDEARAQVEAGIVDWVVAEKRTVIIPDLDHLGVNGPSRIFVLVPLLLRNRAIGVFIISSPKPQEEFSNQDIQLLSILATQAAGGVENWRSYQRLVATNEQLKSSQAQVLQAAKMAAIGELAASIVHEIKNPIQVLMMHMELVQRGKPLPNWVDMLGQQVKRLSDITRRLMSFSRNVSEDVQMEMTSVNKAVEDTVAIVQHEYRNSNIEFELHLKPDLQWVQGNANYLQQVFLNMLLNARDAMPNGGKITITTESSGFNNIIRIADTGVGIHHENLAKVFLPFFTTKGEGTGTGLGLSICQKIIAAHKGEICVQSEVGKGTTFTIFLPARGNAA